MLCFALYLGNTRSIHKHLKEDISSLLATLAPFSKFDWLQRLAEKSCVRYPGQWKVRRYFELRFYICIHLGKALPLRMDPTQLRTQ